MDGARAATGARWYVCALASALVLAFALTAAGTARAASDSTDTLRLDRSDGPPGTMVTATIRGYAECNAPGASSAEAGGGLVEIFWEGVEEAVGSAVVTASGSVEVPFTVPEGATAQKYSIVSRCLTNSKLTDDDLFVVTPPVVVPPSVGPSPSVSPPSVVSPSVVSPSVVSPSVVSPSVSPSETVAPQLVRVPRVVGLTVADAEAKVSALGLVLRVTSGDGDVVASQSPATGSMVGVGHAIRITIKPAVVAPPLIPVPDPAGEQAAPARSAELFPWLRAALLALAVLAFVAVTYLVARRWLDRRWVRNKLKVVVPPAPAIDATITESDPAPPLPVVRIETHADAGIHILRGTD